MERHENIAYWLDIAEYDRVTAHAMLDSKRYLYAVFMCQQAVEKSLRAVPLARGHGAEPPRSHNLLFLLGAAGIDAPPAGFVELLTRLSAFSIEARYPNCKERLSGLVGQAEADELLRRTDEACTWLHSLLR